ncbi:MAG: anthranilate phosphoribosyltransferase [Nitrospirota bacterium]|nr:anthranilate phosphoribosyltransferase [Nitrospirota bacterium]
MDAEAIKEFGAKVQMLIEGRSLTRQETYEMFREVLLNRQPDLQQGAFLAALVGKGETAEEIAGAWEAIDELDTAHTSPALTGDLFENSGTGMDRLKTFNVSSAAAVVAASCGVKMARHGARALTSRCGTVDILEAIGVAVECDVSIVQKSIEKAGIGLFNGMSPKVHPGALGRILSQIRFGSTLNIAASLANPARPAYGLRGVYHERLLKTAGEVMRNIGYVRGMVAHGKDEASGLGMDEISPCGETLVHEFFSAECREYVIRPEELGIKRIPFEQIAFSGSLEAESARFLEVLSGKGHQGCIDFTCLNAGAILYLSGKCDTPAEGVEISRDAINSGKALAKLRQWVSIQDAGNGEGTKRLEAKLEGIRELSASVKSR